EAARPLVAELKVAARPEAAGLDADVGAVGRAVEAAATGRSAREAAEILPGEGVAAAAVVLLALLLVAQRVVGLLDLLEALGRLRVVRVAVRVVLARQLPVLLLDVGGAGVLTDAE